MKQTPARPTSKYFVVREALAAVATIPLTAELQRAYDWVRRLDDTRCRYANEDWDVAGALYGAAYHYDHPVRPERLRP